MGRDFFGSVLVGLGYRYYWFESAYNRGIMVFCHTFD